MREHLVLYGYYVDDWDWDFGSFWNHHYVLDEEYISDACSTTTSSQVTTIKFLYPFNIKKKYAIEGVIRGQFTMTASGATSTFTSYRVTVCKVHSDDTETELFSTDWVTINDSIIWDSTYSIGDEIVYPFWIDALDEEILDENERIFVKFEFNADNNAYLLHYNDATYNDITVDIPIRT